jgi:glycosyltransferase involved in cell wall biosynthesis
MPGFLNGQAKADVLAGADVFLLPSRAENFAVAMFEAFAAGVPVMISDQLDLHQDVEAADAGIVVPLTAQAFATGLRALLADAPRRRELARNGRRFAGRFGWRGSALGLLAEYVRLTGGIGKDLLDRAAAKD